MMSSYPIHFGGILTATDDQFIALWENQRVKKYPRERFLEIFQERQKVALADAELLEKRGFTPYQVGEILADIVEKAKHCFFEVNSAQVGDIQVTGGQLKLREYEVCDLCNVKFPYCDFFRFENVETLKRADFCNELTIHQIQKHDYFGIPTAGYRIYPEKVCNVLGL